MVGGSSRDARRTERYLDGLMEAAERGAAEAPMDLDLDPAILLAAGELRAGLVRVHPSFRFEEGLAARPAGDRRRAVCHALQAVRRRRPGRARRHARQFRRPRRAA
jgi:hypothetical protein